MSSIARMMLPNTSHITHNGAKPLHAQGYLPMSHEPPTSDARSKPRVFVSYSRADGEDFATDLRKRLEAEGLMLWQDRDRMEGGVNWWKQITDALDTVSFMVLVATPAAIASSVVKKEWRHARQQGVCVYPVQVPGLPLDFASMPKWMRDSHFYNLDKEWDTFVNYLKSPCSVTKIPFMAPDLPEHFVQRPAQFDALKAQLLDATFDNPVAITTALRGAGGFGKTTLAIALCHDEDVQTAFDEGVLWVTLGENPNIINALAKLYEALTGERGGFIDIEQGATKLTEKLVDADVLLVIDDVWDTTHVKPFMRGGERVARLMTTRFGNIAIDHSAELLEVDEMTTDESVALLTAGIDPEYITPLQAEFEKLATRLGEWALMLELTNGMLREEISEGASISEALQYVNEVLDEEGVLGIESDSSDERQQSAVGVLSASFRKLKSDERTRLNELSVFVDDSDVPLTSVMALWGLSGVKTKKLLTRFARSSFIRFERERDTIRLHDVVREVLASHVEDMVVLHGRLVNNYGDLTALPDAYAWRNIASHLREAERADALRDLLLNPDYLQNNLSALADPNALVVDADLLPDDRPIQLIQSALRMSAHILEKNPAQGLSQLYGRLLSHHDADLSIVTLLDEIVNHEALPAVLTSQSMLEQAGGALLRIFKVDADSVTAVALDGEIVASASRDKTIYVWNWKTGELLQQFELNKHDGRITSIALSGDYVLSGSTDCNVRLHNWRTSEQSRLLRRSGEQSAALWGGAQKAHGSRVNVVAFAGIYAFSASGFEKPISGYNSIFGLDYSIRVWNWKTGECIQTLTGHTRQVRAVAVVGDCLLSASSDHTIRIWNWKTGEFLHAIKQHRVRLLATTMDNYVISVSDDDRFDVWNWRTSEHIQSFQGKCGTVREIVASDNLVFVASPSNDIGVWNWRKNQYIKIRKRNGLINSLDVCHNILASVSSDKTVRVWNWHKLTDPEISVVGNQKLVPKQQNKGHGGCVIHISPSNDIAISSVRINSSPNSILKVWNYQTGELLRTLEGHIEFVRYVKLLGEFVMGVSLSMGGYGNMLTVWDWQTGRCLHTLKKQFDFGHVSLSDEFAVSASTQRGTLNVWNWRTGKYWHSLEGHTTRVNGVKLSGDFAVSASSDKTLRVWNWKTGKLLHSLEGHTDQVNSVKLSGDFAVSASSDKTLRVWNWKTGKLLRSLEGHADQISGVKLSNEFAVSISPSDTMKVWNWQTGDPVHTLQVRSESVILNGDFILSFPDYRRFRQLVSTNKSASLWNWRTGNHISTFDFDEVVRCIATTSNLDSILVGDCAGTVNLLLPNAALRRVLKSGK
jgi:WD40 repeat protein